MFRRISRYWTDGLLSTLTDVLDIREVFDRVSQLVQRVLPHDLLGVMEISEKGDRIRLLAAAGIAGAPQNFEAPIVGPDFLTKPWNIMVIDDVPNNSFFSRGPAAKAGMQSALTVPISFGGRLRAAVSFFSRETTHFSEADFPIAQRIASYLTFAMSHHRLAEEARQRQALEAHASKLDLLDQLLASLTDSGELKELPRGAGLVHQRQGHFDHADRRRDGADAFAARPAQRARRRADSPRQPRPRAGT
jgi:GAF domain-containing protein